MSTERFGEYKLQIPYKHSTDSKTKMGMPQEKVMHQSALFQSL